MGSGKSTIGRLLADKTGWPYYDNDVLVTMLSGETARGLLAHEGVGELRATEADALLVGLKQAAPCILGAAAGTILDDEMRARLQTEAIVVWLTASPRTLAQRAHGAAHRPWLEGDAEAWMTKTLVERAPLYEATADLKVSTERRNPAAVAAEIANWLSESCS
jgi:shikimate kinase